MGLFDRKRTTFESEMPLYTIGGNKSLLVVGLGNPGDKYAKNRHNVGFVVLDEYQQSQNFSSWSVKKNLSGIIATGQVGDCRVVLLKPDTFMNKSGEALQKVQHYYSISNSDTLVIYDELDVEFGSIRVRSDGGAAGHNGIKSLIQYAGPDFGRIRIGIGPKKPAQMDSADFVLQDFPKKQAELLPKIIREARTLIDQRTVGPLAEETIQIKDS